MDGYCLLAEVLGMDKYARNHACMWGSLHADARGIASDIGEGAGNIF